MIMRRLITLGSVLALAACNSADVASEDTGSVVAPAVAAAQPAPAPPPPPPPPPEPVGPATFLFDGDLQQGGWIKGQVPARAVAARLGKQELTIAEDGRFFAGIDRDAARDAQLVAQLSDGRSEVVDLIIKPRQWNIQRVNLKRRNRSNPEAYWKKREPEYNAIVAARAQATGSQGWKQSFIWPVKGRISGHFGRQRIYAGEPGSYHSGIDIAPGHGVPFVSPADGVVVLARTNFSLEGQLIIIDHGAGLNSSFLHASKIAVSEGQSVKQGQYIGNVGSTGSSTGPHLHWGLKWNDARIDPYLLAGPQ